MGESVTGGSYINTSATGKAGTGTAKGEAHLVEVFFYNQPGTQSSRSAIETMVNVIKVQAEVAGMQVDIYLDNALVSGPGTFKFPSAGGS